MNQNTKQLLEEVGYNYPEYAALAQKLVVALASEVTRMAAANNELKTSQQFTAKFLTPDQPPVTATVAVSAPAVSAPATAPVPTP